ncbi:MAG TPA: ROK family protein, partial [Ilumatobacteraceae bacterium]
MNATVRAGSAVGIDVGGTKCLGVLLDAGGSIEREALRPTPHGPDAIIATLAEVAEELLDGLPASTHVGVGVPGLVTRSGVLRAAPNLVGIA